MPALKRPPETVWKYKQPSDDIYPRCPSAGCFLGPSATGKTTLIVSLILGPYKGVFDRISIWSPSVNIDSAWDPVKEYAKNLEGSSFHAEWDEAALQGIIDEQKKRIEIEKRARSRKPLSSLLILVDDHADDPRVMHSSSNVLAMLFTRGRHQGISAWCSTQKLRAMSTVLRVNWRWMIVFKLRSAKERESLLEELSAIYPPKILLEMYEEAVSEPYSFWYINLVAKTREAMFYVRFEEKLVVDQ